MSGPGSPGSGSVGSGPSPSSTGPRWSPGSARRERGSTLGRVAWSSSHSGRAVRPSAWSSACPSSPPPRTSSRSASSSTGWPSALTEQITARGLAASRARLHLDLDLAFARAGTAAEMDVEQRFPEPTAEAEAIERLLFARLERTPPPAAVARLVLELDGTAPAAGQQLPLFTPQAARGARLEWQLARLALTFGEDRVRRVEVTDPEAPLPETRWAWRPVSRATGILTRLLRGHPAIDVEIDAAGSIVAIDWNGRRETVEVCNRWRVEEAWWRGPIARDYFKVVGMSGWRSSIWTESREHGTSNAFTTRGGAKQD